MHARFDLAPALRGLLRGIACLGLGVVAIATTAAEDTRVRGTVEGGLHQASARSDALLNPGLFDAGQRTLSGAARMQAQSSGARWHASVDLWAEIAHDRVRSQDTQALQLNEALLDFNVSDSTMLGGGVTVASWGTGYVWNPANPVTDPEANNSSRARPYRRDGDGFARMESVLGQDTVGLYLTYFRQNDPLLSPGREREWALYGRYQHVWDGGDATGFLSLGEDEQFVGSAVSLTSGDKLELHGELGLRSRRRAPEVETVEVALGAAPLTVPSWQRDARHAWTPSALVGGQYTFESRTNVILEYFYNGNGYDSDEFSALRRAAPAAQALLAGALDTAGRGFLLEANGLVGRLRRHYLFLRVAQDEVTRDVDLHYYLRLGVEDGAQVHGIFARYALSASARAQISAELYRGPERSEARLIPVRHRIDATLSFDF